MLGAVGGRLQGAVSEDEDGRAKPFCRLTEVADFVTVPCGRTTMIGKCDKRIAETTMNEREAKIQLSFWFSFGSVCCGLDDSFLRR
jgi:hypothetical protein